MHLSIHLSIYLSSFPGHIDAAGLVRHAGSELNLVEDDWFKEQGIMT